MCRGKQINSVKNNKMALKKVKGNFERIFDKNLTDLVRGIRNNKDNEVRLITNILEPFYVPGYQKIQ